MSIFVSLKSVFQKCTFSGPQLNLSYSARFHTAACFHHEVHHPSCHSLGQDHDKPQAPPRQPWADGLGVRPPARAKGREKKPPPPGSLMKSSMSKDSSENTRVKLFPKSHLRSHIWQHGSLERPARHGGGKTCSHPREPRGSEISHFPPNVISHCQIVNSLYPLRGPTFQEKLQTISVTHFVTVCLRDHPVRREVFLATRVHYALFEASQSCLVTPGDARLNHLSHVHISADNNGHAQSKCC